MKISISTHPDGEKAAKEIVSNLLTEDFKPDLLILFSTIHYKSYFKEILSILNCSFDEVPLIGGTCAGFTCRKGSFTKGIVLVSFSFKSQPVFTSMYKNVKRNPVKGADKCAQEIQEQMNNKNLEGTTFVFYSGPVFPRIPILGERKYLSFDLNGLYDIVIKFLLYTTQTGVTRATEFLRTYFKYFSNSALIGGCTEDNTQLMEAWEFYNTKCFRNTVCCAFIPLKSSVYSVAPVVPTKGPFKIKKSVWNFMLKKINNHPAKKFLIEEVLKVDESLLNTLNIRRTYFPLYFPFGEKDTLLGWRALPIGPIYGNSIVSNDIYGDEIYIMYIHKKTMLDQLITFLLSFKKEPFLFGVGCSTLFEILGKEVYYVNSVLNKNFTDYFIVWLGGEFIGLQDQVRSLNYTLNILKFS